MRLRGFEAELPAELRDLPSSEDKPSEPAASGVREFSSKTHGSSARPTSWLTTTTRAGSFQLCKLGVEMTLLRLTQDGTTLGGGATHGEKFWTREARL